MDGFTFERVFHISKGGFFSSHKEIGGDISAGEVIAFIEDQPLKSKIGDIVRCLLRDGMVVKKGTKLGEIDPSGIEEACIILGAR